MTAVAGDIAINPGLSTDKLNLWPVCASYEAIRT